MAKQVVDLYQIGNIAVTVTETDRENKLLVDCNDGSFHSSFTIRKYEYKNYKRHMNQRIKNAYKKEYEEE